MAKGRRVSGIFVPIQLDTSAVQRDMEGLGNQLSSSINKISKSLEGALNPKYILKGVVELNKGLGQLRDSTKIWDDLTSGTSKFERAMKELEPEMKSLAAKFGGTVEQQKEMYSLLVQNQAVRQEVDALKMWQKALGVTEERILELVKARGHLVSDAAIKEFIPQKEVVKVKELQPLISKTAQEYQKLGQAAGLSASQMEKGFEAFRTGKEIDAQIAAFKVLRDTSRLTREEFINLARQATHAKEILATLAPEEKGEPLNARVRKLVDEYKRLVQLSGGTASREGVKAFINKREVEEAISSFKRLNDTAGKTRAEIEKLVGVRKFAKEIVNAIAPAEDKLKHLNDYLRKFAPEYSALMRATGGTRSQEGFMAFVDERKAQEAVLAFRRLKESATMTKEQIVELVNKSKYASRILADLYPVEKAKPLNAEMRKIVDEYRRLASLSGTAMNKDLFKAFADNKKIKSAIDTFQQLHNGQQVTAKDFEQIAKRANVTTKQVEEYVKALDRASGANTRGGRGWSGIFTPSNVAAGAQSALSALGVVGGMYGVVELGKAMYQASLKMENFQLAFQSIYGSSARAAVQLEYVRKICNRLGLAFEETAHGAKQLFAAAKGTEVENDANQIFEAFSAMGAALKLSSDEMGSVMLAVSQMISKGKISAEELRLQLAERMPGAVTLFAKSIGKTTKELDAMLQKGEVGLDSLKKFAIEVEKTYSAGAKAAANGLQAEINRVANAWFDLKRAFVDSDKSARALSTLTDSLNAIRGFAPEISAVASALGKFAILSGGVYMLIKALQGLKLALASVVGLSGPVGFVVSAVGLFGTALWELSSRQTDGEKVMEKYSGSVATLDDWVKQASGNTEALAESIALATQKKTEFDARMASKAVEDLVNPKLKSASLWEVWWSPSQATWSKEAGFGLLEKSPLQNLVEDMLDAAEDNKNAQGLANDAKNLATVFAGSFKENLKKGELLDKLLTDIDSFEAKAQTIILAYRKEIGEDASTEVADSYAKVFSSLIGAMRDAATKAEQLKQSAMFTQEDVSVMNAFSTAYSSVLKATEKTHGNKDENAIAELVTPLKALAPVATAAEEKIAQFNDGMGLTEEETARCERVITEYNDAMNRVAEAAGKSGLSLRQIMPVLEGLRDKLKMTEEQWRSFVAAVSQQVTVSVDFAANTGAMGLEQQLLVSDMTKGQQRAFSVLTSSIKDADTKLALAKVGLAKYTDEWANAGISVETFNRALAAGNALAAKESASKGAKSAVAEYNRLTEILEQSQKKIEEWQGKNEDSKSQVFAASLKKDLLDLDEAMQRSKGSSAMIAKLRSIREEMERVGEARVKALKDEEEEAARKELTKFNTRITSAYKKLKGEDNSEVYLAAKDQYDLDVQYLKKALDEKLINQEQFVEKMRMLNETLRDTELRSQTDLYSRLTVAANDYFKKYGDFTRHIGGVITNALDSCSDAIAKFVRSGIRDFESLGDAFQALAEDMLQTAVKLFANQVVSSMFSGVMGLFGGGNAVSRAASAATSVAASVKSANGNVFSGGNLSAYSDSIVSTPTTFSFGSHLSKFAMGGGLMGEAGPEAIMPLVRTSSGHLGVRSEGGGMNQVINVNVINNAGVDVNTRETKDDDGNVSIEIMLDQQNATMMRRPGSATYKAMQGMWGGRSALAKR